MKNKKSLIIIIILSVLLLSLIGYVVYDKLYAMDDKIVKEEKEVVSRQLVDSIYDSLLVGSGDEKKGFYYDEKVTIDDISDSLLLDFIATAYSVEKDLKFNIYKYTYFDKERAQYYYFNEGKTVFVSDEANSENIVPKTELEKFIKEKFNVDRELNVKDGTITYLSLGTSEKAYYKASNKSFYFYDESNDDVGTQQVVRKFLNYNVSGDNLYIYDKAVTCVNFYGCDKAYTFNYEDREILFNDEISNSNNYSTNLEDYKVEWNIDKIIDDFDVNTFKHTFKKASNGYYYWYSTEIDNSVK